jgi:predicted Zn-dependent peptidase
VTTVAEPRTLPPLEENRELVLPASVERTLPNGLTVIAIPRRSVPLVEVRLRVPLGRPVLDPAGLATATLLSQTLFSGTDRMSTVEIAAALQGVGGALSAGTDPDRLLVSGNGLAAGLDRILDILADVLHAATYPAGEVETERARLIDRLQVAQSQPSHLARVALLKRVYGTHPYAVQTPETADVAPIGTADLLDLHARRLRPAGATLVLVGDVEPEAAIDAAERALGSWRGTGEAADTPPTPKLVTGPIALSHRPGVVQSSLRLALPGVPRTHPDHAALMLANLVFGGYFSSRWVENIREDKGYTYGPHSLLEHSVAGSVVTAQAEVATEVTAPALLETWYELGRLATVAPEPEELEQARQYALGSLLLGVSTQAGLAGLASSYAGFGLRLDFLVEHAARLAATTREEVTAAAAKYLAPARAVTVILGDADRVRDSLGALGPVEVQAAPAPADAGEGEEPAGA